VIVEKGVSVKLVLTMAVALALAAAAEEPAPAPAPAPQTAEQVRAVVQLRDGSTVRGTVSKMRLGKSITLALPSGKSILLNDKDIVVIELYGGAAPAGTGKESPGAFPEQTVTARHQPGSPVPQPQSASASGLDTVYLANGGVLRGTIESEKPELVLRLLSGKKRSLPAASVQRIERARRQ
jgi:hypothetical protein